MISKVKSKQAYSANVGVHGPNMARESSKENVITSVMQFILFWVGVIYKFKVIKLCVNEQQK
jgi:hypothetical protein